MQMYPDILAQHVAKRDVGFKRQRMLAPLCDPQKRKNGDDDKGEDSDSHQARL